MGWAASYIAELKNGKTVSFRPKGNSMQPKIESGQLCTVSPVNFSDLEIDDVVLCKVNGSDYLHLILAKRNGQVQIGNNKGRINGWIGSNSVFGKLERTEQ